MNPDAPRPSDSPPDAAPEAAAWTLLVALHTLRTHVSISRPAAGPPGPGGPEDPALRDGQDRRGADRGRGGLSVILLVEAARRQLVVDALRDPVDWAVGERLQLDTQVDGRRLRFECELEAHVQVQGAPAYALRNPVCVLDRQRRNSYRVRLPSSLRVSASVDLPNRRVPARLVDLSTGGCCARVESAGDVHRGDPLRIRVQLPGMDLACEATLRHLERSHGTTRLGMAFQLDPPGDLPGLSQAVARLQREILRRRQGE